MSRPANASGGLFLFVGPDRTRKLERIETIAHTHQIHLLDRHHVQAADVSVSTFLTLIREYPARSSLRLVVVDEAQRLDRACLKYVADHPDGLPRTTALIFLVDGDLEATHPLAALQPHASTEQFAWLTPPAVRQWVTQYLAASQKDIEDIAIHELIAQGGSDLAGIRGVLDQVISWVGSRTQVTAVDVRTFVYAGTARRTAEGAASTKESFALVNAIARRDLGAALGAIQDQLASGKEVLELLGLVMWQLQRWLLVGHLLEAGTALGRIADLTGLRPGQLERIRAELTGRSLTSLRRALQACWQLDVSAKRGQVPLLRVALEQVVVELCLPAPVAPRQTRVPAKASFAVADE